MGAAGFFLRSFYNWEGAEYEPESESLVLGVNCLGLRTQDVLLYGTGKAELSFWEPMGEPWPQPTNFSDSRGPLQPKTH